jgi:hypothetical protein
VVVSGLPGGAPGLRVYDDLGEVYDVITGILAPVVPGGYTAITDDAMDDPV